MLILETMWMFTLSPEIICKVMICAPDDCKAHGSNFAVVLVTADSQVRHRRLLWQPLPSPPEKVAA